MKKDKEWLKKVVPYGGRFHKLVVPVDESLLFCRAVGAVNPDVDQRVWGVRDFVDAYYPPRKDAAVEERHVLMVNFPSKTPFDEMKGWADRFGLTSASIRTVLAIGQHCPTLRQDLGVEELSVLFFEVFRLKAYFTDDTLDAVFHVLWRDGKRKVYFDRVDICWDESNPFIAFMEGDGDE